MPLYLACFFSLVFCGIFTEFTAQAASEPFDSATFNKNTQTLTVQRVTPAGRDVPAGRQIVFQFNRPVVPVGQMERDSKEIPVTLSPEVQCEWRWLNTSALACQLGSKTALKAATRYRILMQPGIKTEDGGTLQEPLRHEFITIRPRISYYSFNTWKAPGMPEIRVSFNQPVSLASVEKHLYMQENGQRIAVQAKTADQKNPRPEYALAWIVSPEKMLGDDSSAQLQVEPGLQSQIGPERGVESRVIVAFDTFPLFRFVGVSCTDNQGNELVFAPTPQASVPQRCNPLRRAAMMFSTPVGHEEIKKGMIFTPDLAGGRKDFDPWQNAYSYSRLGYPHKRGTTYKIWFPQLLKAYDTYHLSATADKILDAFGRKLETAVDMRFATDHRPPDYHFEHNISVLEKGVDSEVPIVVTNLKELDINYNLLTVDSARNGMQRKLTVPAVEDVAFRIPLDIRKLVPASSGVVQGSFDSDPKPYSSYHDGWFFAQVTPFHVQVKLGHHNTLVWITDFATGQPVEGVELGIYQGTYGSPGKTGDILSKAVTDENGIAMLDGLVKIDPDLNIFDNYQRHDSHLFLHASKGSDLALMSLFYDFGVDMYSLSEDYVYTYNRERFGHIHTWGNTAQGVYKVGDTIQYKLVVRDQSNTGFIPAPADGYTLEVSDPTGKTVHEVKDLKLSGFGSYAGEFTLPKTAAVGWYQFNLSAKFAKNRTWQPMNVLVSDFTPSPFRVQAALNGALFRAGEQVEVETHATLHAGGPYSDAHTAVYAQLRQEPFSSNNPEAKDFQFDTWVDGQSGSVSVYEKEDKLDGQGHFKTAFTIKDSPVLYGRLNIESTVRDDRGKDVAGRISAQYVGRDRFVGVKQSEWVLQQYKPATFHLVVVDEHGKPAAGTPIQVTSQRRETKAVRVKGAGNAYLTQYKHEWVDEGSCQAQSAVIATQCSFTPQYPGSYRFSAEIKDSQGRVQKTVIHRWVSGKGHVVWESSPGHGLVMKAEKDTYQVGDTARYVVQNPFPGAKALITVERFGILKSWLETFNNSVEIIEFPVEKDYIPGFYVSVMVMSPRVDKPIKDHVDLGKPAFRMGYAKADVPDPYKQLVVDIKTDKPVYKPREEVSIDLQAKALRPEGFNEPVEIALAVLDESVFDLLSAGRGYFDPYEGFYTLDELDVANFNILLRLVGRQKFEKKGASPGGDGGADLSLRSLFKFVSYWNPSIRTDAEGKAKIQFKLPDNLTGWRVLAMALSPTERMGLSDANFKVNQPLELRPVLPNQVTAGDVFEAGFSIMNRTDSSQNIKLDISAGGPIKTAPGQNEQSMETTLLVEPFKRKIVWLPLETLSHGELQLTATAQAGDERDGLKKTLPVRKKRSLETGATYGTTVSGEVEESIQFPKDIHADAGGLSVTASPTVISNVDGAFSYMINYPYACWEQKLSKGTMALHYQNLKPWVSDEITWPDSAELPAKTLQLAVEHQAPNGGMAYYVPKNDRASPYLSAYTALAFNWLRDSGQIIPQAVESKLHDYLLTLLRRNEVPSFYTAGMSSTVRAVALAALARSGKLSRSDISRYQSHVEGMSLFGKAHFLMAALQFSGTDAVRHDTADKILSQSVQSGGKVTFNETLDDSYQRILASPVRTNCAVLSALTAYAMSPGAKGVGDMPVRLARSIIAARKSRTHWANTQENMFCMNALTDYARVFEKDSPDMQVTAWLAEEKLGDVKFSDVKDPPVKFTHDMTPADPGRKASVKIQREGKGRLYYGVHLRYAPLAEKATTVNAGIEVNREYHVERNGHWEMLTSPVKISSGELVRVDLYISLPTARNFVVVDDPVPGGLEPVNRDLATASHTAADKAQSTYSGGSYWYKYDGWLDYGYSFWSFYHRELRHHAALFYSDYLPAGNYHLSYVAQAVAPGKFSAMPTHAEEMYEPDIYGKSLPAVFEISKAE